jgi:hypothetical protein
VFPILAIEPYPGPTEFALLPSCFVNILFNVLLSIHRDSAVGIVTVYGMNGEGSEFESRYGQDFSPFDVQTSSVASLTSYSMGTGGSFPGTIVAGA